MSPALVVEAFRGGSVESRHEVDAVVSAADGNRIYGDGGSLVFLRSAAKPFQAAAVVAGGAVERFAIPDDELAVIAASHSGEEMHTTRVARLLARLGLDASALRCGTHPPLHEPTARALAGPPTALHHNCSGKHAGMIALARALGCAPETYLDVDGPVQRAMRRALATAAGIGDDDVVVAIDGCSAATFALPLRAGARAFRALAAPETIPGEIGRALARVAAAMVAHPDLVAGTGRFDTRLMHVAPWLLSKGGAEGVQGVGDRARGVGLCLKVRDGSARAVAPATLEMLLREGLADAAVGAALVDERRPTLLNHAGRVVGHVAARAPQPS